MEASPQVIGRYAIYGKIASGGMASVHFGRLLGGAGFSRTVAIKRLHPHLAEDPEFLSTMIDEARLAARINHPNVVPTLDVVAMDGELLLVMEYVRGESLARLIRYEAARGSTIPLSITGAIAHGALHGLHAAHEATSDQGQPLGIVHRDISPQNILVSVDGVARVIDFGVAKAAGRLQETAAGTIKGKIAYMAPEQLAGRDVTRAADIYAMGAVLWESLTGKRLFQADSDAALMAKVMAGPPDPPSRFVKGLPPEVDALTMKALAKNPADRFSTAREMADLLTRVLPPALPSDVGEWCTDVARDAIAKRNLFLAEIESTSGVAAIAAPTSSPDLASHPSLMSSSRSRSQLRKAQTHADALPPPPAELIEAEPQTTLSQPSSVSMAAQMPTSLTRTPSRSHMGTIVGAIAGVTLVGLGVAVGLWGAGRHSAPATTTMTTVASVPTPPVPAAEVPAAPSAAQAAEPAAAPPSTASTEIDEIPSAVAARPGAHGPSSASPAAPATRRPAPAANASPVAAQATRPTTAPPPASAKTADSCNPPFTYDPNGNKHFKPECFGR